MATTSISFQEFCVKNNFPLNMSYRALVKYVAEAAKTIQKPEGKRKFDINFSDQGFLVKDYGTKRTYYIVTDETHFRWLLSNLIGFENVVSREVMREIFRAAITGYRASKNRELVERNLRRVGFKF